MSLRNPPSHQNAGSASIASMASLSIRRIPEDVLDRLRVQAAKHGVSMEEEARRLIKAGVAGAEPVGALARELFGDDGADLEIPPREIVAPVDLS